MKKRNMLGEICTYRPFRLRYLTDDEKAVFLTEHGFPAETPVDDMEAEAHKTAYWRNQSKVQQKKNEGVDVTKLQADSAELERLRKEGLDANERAVEEAREQARREGENIGAGRYLKDAVTARFQFLTGKSDEEVATTFEHVDAASFTDDKGEIIADKLKAFAATFGPKGSTTTTSGDPVADALARQRAAGGGSGGSSITDKRKATRDSLTKTKA